MKIAINGCGIAGLAAGILLHEQGHAVELFEKSVSLRSQGAGITLGPNAMKVLSSMGLADQIAAQGEVIKTAAITNEKMEMISQIDFGKLAARTGWPMVAIEREKLHHLLQGKLPSEKVKAGNAIISLREEEAVHVVTNDGQEKSFDLVIGADGLHSGIRKISFGEVPTRYSGYVCWRLLIKADIADTSKVIEMWGKGKRLGIVPVGGGIVYCFLVLNHDLRSPLPGPGELKEIFSSFTGGAEDIVARLDETTLIFNELHDLPHNYLHAGRVVLIGDAAHAMTPNLGQGAAMALEDVYQLSALLAREKDVPVALSMFSVKRDKRLTMIKNRSWTMGKLGQLENSFAMRVRNSVLGMIPDAVTLRDLEKMLMGFE